MRLTNLNIVKTTGIISTDDIIPAHYKHKFTDPNELAKHVFENKFPDLPKEFTKKTVIISDDTFGIGSSREQAVSSLLAAGVVAIISPRFGRIFFRNCWNLGLVAIESDLYKIADQKNLSIDLEKSFIIFPDREIQFQKLPSELIKSFNFGGLLQYVKNSVLASPVCAEENKQAFAGLAQKYDYNRPRYPRELYSSIIAFWYQKQTDTNVEPSIADVGCGTGISTRAFFAALNEHCTITGVEPGKDMLSTAIKLSSGKIAYHEGTADALPLGPNSVDIITAAQAAQWFDRPGFYREARRVLRPQGVIAIYENNRDWEHSEFLDNHEKFLETYSVDKTSGKRYRRDYRDFPYSAELAEHFSDSCVQNFFWIRKMTPEDFLSMAKTSTQVRRAEKYIDEKISDMLILENAKAHVETDNQVEVKYNTKLYMARK